MNIRPTRVPSPPMDDARFHSGGDESVHPDRMADATREMIEQRAPVERVNHSPPAVRQQQEENQITPQASPPRERVEFQPTGFGKVVEAISNIMAEIKPVQKLGWNKFHGYAHARIGDLNAELTPLMGKHGIVIFQNEIGRDLFDGGAVVSVRYEFTVVHKSGEIWPERPVISGVARCRTSKESFDDKTFNKCHTAARKYFLISLFQIPVEDADDADGGEGGSGNQQARPRPQGRRPVPSPNGKVPPHLMPIGPDDTPQGWATRFGEAISKADTVEEIDQWYSANAVQFDKLKKFEQVYNDAIDFMDACAAKLAAPAQKKTDPISTGKPESDFPGDKPLKVTAKPPIEVDLTIPIALDRNLTDPERDFLMACDEAFKACTDIESLMAEQQSVMMPSKDSVSEHAWARAVGITKLHLERVQDGG